MTEIFDNFPEKCCISVWRSIGSNIFFEFGMPNIKRVRPKLAESFMMIQGELSIGIHADDWELRHDARTVLDSNIVNEKNLRGIAKEFVIGKPLPSFELKHDDAIELVFEGEVSLMVRKSNFYLDDGDAEDEISIRLPNGERHGFDFERGFNTE